MKFAPLLTTLVLLAGIVFLLWHKPSDQHAEKLSAESSEIRKDLYQQGPETPDGTGKYYFGREIAKVMGHPAIKWLERDNREDEEAPSKAIELLDLAPDAIIADIGAGSGYYTFRLAAQHPGGHVIAVDIQEQMVSYLQHEKDTLGVENVSAHLGRIDDTLLAENSIDAALMVDAYHEFSHPYEMVQSIKRALRPGGRLFLLEYRAEDPTVPIKPLHKMSEEQVIKEISAVGLKWVATKHDLPWQHLFIFEKK